MYQLEQYHLSAVLLARLQIHKNDKHFEETAANKYLAFAEFHFAFQVLLWNNIRPWT